MIKRIGAVLPISLVLIVALLVAACGSGASAESAFTSEPTQAPDTVAQELTEEEEAGHAHDEEASAMSSHDETEEAGHSHGEVLDTEHHQGEGIIEGAPEVVIHAFEWGFGPAEITLTAGEPVNLVLVNDGIIEHEVNIPALDIHIHTPTGQTGKAGFIPDQVGTFELACNIPGHREAGMIGAVTVVTGDSMSGM